MVVKVDCGSITKNMLGSLAFGANSALRDTLLKVITRITWLNMKVELSIVTCVTRFFGVDEGFKSIVCSIRKDDDDDFVCNQVDGSELYYKEFLRVHLILCFV